VLSSVLAQLSMACFVKKTFAISLDLEVVEKANKIVKVLWSPIIMGGTTPTFLRQIVSAIYRPPFGCSVC